jgi:DNA-binding transcriptional regulator YdaS (Cro superfamily)
MNPAEYKSTRETVGTQQQVVDLLGVSRSTIARRESPAGRITEEAAIAIRELARTTKPRRSKRP